ncbi:MAG: GTPase [Candidatus Aenigmarchaeota archaeon]|nr:GTPase [Candidatus Aenigmarchaeota archaeon]
MTAMKKIKVIILGAAGRDFHNFNVVFRKDPRYNVVAFTTAQILQKHRTYPPSLAGRLYPKGIPIHPESELHYLIKKHGVDLVVFAYSDVSHEEVMHRASIALAGGTNFVLLGPRATSITTRKPLISVCAVRTGAGKSPTSRFIADYLKGRGHRVVVIRHPMPYGDLKKQAVQRFARYEDLDKHDCTIEEREEYEPHIRRGIVVYAGVDYEKILRSAERESDVIIFDGGNNDFSFYDSKRHLRIVVADPHRAGHEMLYHPGETNFRIADVIVISKVNTAPKEGIARVEDNARAVNPKAKIVRAPIEITVSDAAAIRGRKVIVVEDGPTLTHGGMKFGAGYIAAKRYGANIIDAKKHAIGSIKKAYLEYPHLEKILPAMGYTRKQVKELEKTINAADCDAIMDASPVALSRLIRTRKPIVEVEYELREKGKLAALLRKFEKNIGKPKAK